ncbi:hypothetical protein ScPMuIL_016515 [Solemya velum]
MTEHVVPLGSGLQQSTPISTYNIISHDNTSNATPSPLARCEDIRYEYNIAPAIICSMCFVFGIVYTFFGYRFFKAVMFLTGFSFGAILVYLICIEHDVLPPGGNAGVAAAAGILCGLITMLVQYVGLFLTGFHLGISIAIGALVVIEQFYHPETKWIPIGLLVGIGLVFALVILKCQRSGTILGTSVFGGGLMIACLDYFIEQFMMVNYIWERVKAEPSQPVCWYSWLVLGCWPFCFFVGIITQWRITSHGYKHEDALLHKKKRKVNLQKLRAKERKTTNQSRYRHLYQVRRVNGDVISQNYIQCIQHELSPPMRSQNAINSEPTTEVDSAHTTLTQVP